MSESKKILVVGGAGYIGSHMVKHLLQKGCSPIVIDNLSTGYRDAVIGGEFILCDLSDADKIREVLFSKKIDAVMHFASFIQVGESVEKPGMYYQNNVANTLNLLNAMVEANIKKFIFSSTAAIFGQPEYTPIDESHPKNPINPYGQSKWMVEQILKDFDSAYQFKSICLRYFNAAGADTDGQLGERHDPETHLIPLVLQAAAKRRKSIAIYGDDYDTEDGSCIRDYIHIVDLCEAHWLALNYLDQYEKSDQFNLGNGKGFSVKQVINVAREVTQKEIEVINDVRRAGDPAVLVAKSSRAKQILNWQPMYPELDKIILHAWMWEQHHFGSKKENQ